MSPESAFSAHKVRPGLWDRLHSPRLTHFYTELRQQRAAMGEDWQPMEGLLRFVKGLRGALRLSAFVSGHRLNITTAERYVDSAGHQAVFAEWDPAACLFHVGTSSLDHHLGAEPQEEYRLAEDQAAAVLPRLLDRLLGGEPGLPASRSS